MPPHRTRRTATRLRLLPLLPPPHVDSNLAIFFRCDGYQDTPPRAAAETQTDASAVTPAHGNCSDPDPPVFMYLDIFHNTRNLEAIFFILSLNLGWKFSDKRGPGRP